MLLIGLSLEEVGLIVLEEEEPHEVDVIGKFLDFDDIREGHLGILADPELLASIDVRRFVLLVNLALAQVVVLDERLTRTEDDIAAIVLLSTIRCLMLLLCTAVAFELLVIKQASLLLRRCLLFFDSRLAAGLL